MPDNNTITKITGPPGCGKTTEILRLVKQAMQRYFPMQIGAVSFTNAAVETIKDRIASEGVDRTMVKNVRTLHSHCFKLLGLNTKNIAEYNLSSFNRQHPQFGVKDTKADEGSEKNFQRRATGTYLYNQMNLMRNHCIDRDKWPPDITAFGNAWFRWMEDDDMWDFTRMLEVTADKNLYPENLEILFVDESQDLTPLQMKVIMTWQKEIGITYFAGDSDQCIFRFGGAVPEAFINLKYSTLTHLEQSYRVPPAVHAYATRILQQIKNRENTTYHPDTRRGTGELLTARKPDLTMDGSHMIICRCNYQVNNWINWLTKKKILWSNPYRLEDLSWNPQQTKTWRAVTYYQRFMQGGTITLDELHVMIDCVVAKDNIRRGFKNYAKNYKCEEGYVDMFDQILLGLTDRFMDTSISASEKFKIVGRSEPVLLYMLDRQESLADKPRVIVGTIHSVKGGEADNVWIDPSIPGLIWKEMRKDERTYYDEARVAYVAATRARNRLGILSSNSRSPIYPTT